MRRASIAAALVLIASSAAVPVATRQAAAFDAAAKKTIVDGAIDHMQRAYIFADVADKMAVALRAHAAAGAYEAIADPRVFAETMTRHLQDVSRDKHLRIVYNPEGLP